MWNKLPCSPEHLVLAAIAGFLLFLIVSSRVREGLDNPAPATAAPAVAAPAEEEEDPAPPPPTVESLQEKIKNLNVTIASLTSDKANLQSKLDTIASAAS